MDSHFITISPKGKHEHTLIWVHGLNMNPEKDAHIFEDKIFETFKIILPKAPIRYVTTMKK